MSSKNQKKDLTENDINLLKANTQFDREQIISWYARFKQECPRGTLDKEAFIKFYSELLPDHGNPDEFSSYVFKAFDQDDSGTIDFGEFLLAFSITARGNLQDRLNWAFNFYDQDGSNFIDLKEFKRILVAIYKMMGIDNKGENSAEAKASEIFSSLDSNNDKSVSRQEFIRGCFNDPFLRHLLSPNI